VVEEWIETDNSVKHENMIENLSNMTRMPKTGIALPLFQPALATVPTIRSAAVTPRPQTIRVGTGILNYGESEYGQIIECPYAEDQFTMFVLLPMYQAVDPTRPAHPYPKSLQDLENELTPELLSRLLRGMRATEVNYTCLPKFDIRTAVNLTGHLSAAGMSALSKQNPVSCAKPGPARRDSSLYPTREFHANRSFLFLLRDTATGEFTFLGKILI
jgi:serine protease inhibitor